VRIVSYEKLKIISQYKFRLTARRDCQRSANGLRTIDQSACSVQWFPAFLLHAPFPFYVQHCLTQKIHAK